MFSLAAALLLTGTAAPAAALFDAKGYRSERYRSPVDRLPTPATPIDAAEVRTLAKKDRAILIDVLPAEGGRRDAKGRWHLATHHQTIPGALWFPEVGRASPEPVLWRAFAERISRLRRTRPAADIVVFCRADCWMSWNAARRLALGGQRRVRWFSDGIEGWHHAGGKLVPARPEQAPPSPDQQGE